MADKAGFDSLRKGPNNASMQRIGPFFRLLACASLLSAFDSGLSARPASDPQPVSVFAAAPAVDVLERIGDAFSKETGVPVLITGGGSPALADRILAGASADLFIPSGRGVMAALLKVGMVNEDSSFLWATNGLVVVASASVEPPTSPREMAAARFRRLALPDPRSTNLGSFARQALTTTGIWEDVQGRLISAPDAVKVLALVEAGEADLGIVFTTDARRAPNARVVLSLPPGSHESIPYPAALVAHPSASPAARRFLDFLKSAQARRLLEGAGFTPAFP